MMRRLATLLLGLGLVLGSGASYARDKHVLWAVQGQHNTVYLLGSIHVLRPDDAGLPDVAQRAYEDAEQLVMEVDLDDPLEGDPMAMLEEMQRMALLPEGQSLRGVLGPDYAAVAERAKQSGLDLALLDGFAPWFVATSLLQVELAKRGYTPEFGIEQVLAARAAGDHKPIQGLETAAQQFGMLAGMPLPMQKRFLMMTLDESAQLDQEIDQLVGAWRNGDTAKLASLLSEEFDEFPDLYRTLTVDRNRAWMTRLTDLLDDRDDYLVVVGALHLVGDGSVVSLLEKRGFKVVQQ
jgi:uncharacterized protein YbaP (TraB family)